jgi:hypothetical protein
VSSTHRILEDAAAAVQAPATHASVADASAAASASSAGRFVRRWVAATFGGWVLGFLLVLLLLPVTGLLGFGDLQLGVGLGMGAGVGLSQARRLGWLAEGRHDRRTWAAASALGMSVPFLILDLARSFAIQPAAWLPVCVAAGGVVTGLLQLPIARRGGVRGVRWIVASTLGWSLAGLTVPLTDRYVPKIPGTLGALLFVSGVLLGGVILGIVGGAALAWFGRVKPGRTKRP